MQPQSTTTTSTPAAHSSTLRDAVFSGDGRRLYSVSAHDKPRPIPRDGEVRVWDVEGREELAFATGLDLLFKSVAVAPDGRLVTVAEKGRSGTMIVHAWDVREQP